MEIWFKDKKLRTEQLCTVRVKHNKASKRLQEHKFFLSIAQKTSERSKCVSHKVGCVIVRKGDIVVSGYNGTPPKYPNCCEVFPNGYADTHHDWSNHHEVHAEQNAISRASKHGIKTNKSTAYCTLKPCMHCTKSLIMAGIKKIYYIDTYGRNDDITLDAYIKANKVKIKQITME
jgi:dCMP deaminase